jgi:phosphoribosylglycinamide formyltransferase-1
MIQPISQAHVLAAGVNFSGPTIHLVDAEYDHGQILAHWPIRIRPDDTPESLNMRCNLAGMPLYVQAIKDFVRRLDRPDEF